MRAHVPISLITVLATAVPAAAQLNDYDSRIDSYVGLRFPCDGGVQPVLRIQNVGGETMTSCDIDVLKNGLVTNTFNWQLASPAATNEFRQPLLPPMADVEPGDELEFRILTVNGQPDEGEEENILTVPMTDEKHDAASYQVEVKVLTDDAPEETSWTIKSATGAVVAQSPAYSEGGTLHATPVVLSANGCYAFEVKDAGGDGFGEARELGYARLVSLGSDVNVVSGDFGSTFREGVEAGSANGCQPTQLTATADPVISCGALGLSLNGTSTIHATNVAGANKYQFRFTNVAGQPAYTRHIVSPTRSLTLSTWATLPLKKGRTYNVQVRSSFDNGASWCPFGPSCTVRIGFGFAGGTERMDTVGAQEDAVFTIFPNPSADGTFSVIANGMDEEETVTVDVFDLLGARVAGTTMGSMASGAPVPLALERPLASGVYLLHLTVGESVISERLVVR